MNYATNGNRTKFRDSFKLICLSIAFCIAAGSTLAAVGNNLSKEQLGAIVTILLGQSVPPETITGRAIDGYIRGANVYLDLNGNGVLDLGEPSATSGVGGRFEIELSDEQALCVNLAPIVADVPAGAYDEDHGPVAEPFQLTLPPGTSEINSETEVFITPLTSVLWAELYRLGLESGLTFSCESLKDNPENLDRLRELIDSAVSDAVRRYNVPADKLLTDYISLNDSQVGLTAEEIVRGLKASLAQRLLTQAAYPSADSVSAEVRRSTGGEEKDPSLDDDELGWYMQIDVFDQDLTFTETWRLGDDVTSKEYLVYYRETEPYQENSTGVNYGTTFELELQEAEPRGYSCAQQEHISAESELADDGSRYEVAVTNWVQPDSLVDQLSTCREMTGSLTQRYVFVTQFFDNEPDNITSDSVQYIFGGNEFPYLNDVRDLAADPDSITKTQLLDTLTALPWRFGAPADEAADSQTKSLAFGDSLGLSKSIDGSAYSVGEYARWDKTQALEDMTTESSCALAPFDADWRCIEWQTFCPDGSGPDAAEPAKWLQLGNDLDLPAPDKSIANVNGTDAAAMNSDGTIVAVGLKAQSKVLVYQWRDGRWEKLGGDITENIYVDSYESFFFGHSLALSADGGAIIIGSRLKDRFSNVPGSAQVMDLINGEWVQRGRIFRTDHTESIGWDVDMSADGSRILVHSITEGEDRSTTRVYDWAGSAWKQIGGDVVTLFAGGAYQAQLTSDGTMISIWGPRHAAVYSLVSGQWEQVGGTLARGEAFESAMWKPHGFALAESGTTVAIRDENGISVHDLDQGAWRERAGSIPTEFLNGLKASLVLRNNGNRLYAVVADGLFATWDWRDDEWVPTTDWAKVVVRNTNQGSGFPQIAVSEDGSRVLITDPRGLDLVGAARVFEFMQGECSWGWGEQMISQE